MPKGNGTTVDVHVIKAEAQLAAHGEELGGKGFVGFDLIEIGHCPTSLFQSLAGGGDGAKAHHVGFHTGTGPAHNAGERRKAPFSGQSGIHEHQSRRAVVHAGSVARRHHAVLLEGGAQLAEHVHGGAGAGELITSEIEGFFLLLHVYGHDLFIEHARFQRGCGPLLGKHGMGVQFFTGKMVAGRHVLGGDAHVIVVESVPEAVPDHLVHKLGIAHAAPPACGGQDIGSLRHVLHAACHHTAGLSGADGQRGFRHGLEAGTADLVHRPRRDLHGDTGLDGGLTRGVLAQPRLKDVAHDDFFHHAGIHATPGKGRADDHGPQLDGRDRGERTAETAQRGTGCAYDDHFTHNDSCPAQCRLSKGFRPMLRSLRAICSRRLSSGRTLHRSCAPACPHGPSCGAGARGGTCPRPSRRGAAP